MGEDAWRGATIVWARVAELRAFTAVDLAEMGESQRVRLGQLSGARAAAFLAGRALIREVVLRLGGGPRIPLDSRCERCGQDHSVPRTPGFTLSVSHADGLVAVAASRGTDALGIDLESDGAASRVAQLGPIFAPADPPDLAAWTRIEAAIKADGRGVGIDPATVRLRDAAPNGGAPQWSVVLPGSSSTLHVTTLPGPDGHTLSIARG